MRDGPELISSKVQGGRVRALESDGKMKLKKLEWLNKASQGEIKLKQRFERCTEEKRKFAE